MYVLYKYTENKYKLEVQKERRNRVATSQFNSDIVRKQEPITVAEELRRISISRIKRMIYNYTFCNDFKFFGTITVDSKNCDRFNLEECFSLLRKTINQMKNKYKWKREDFRYIIVCEKHKDSAFHFHGLFSEVLENDLYINSNGYLSSNYFDRVGRINSWSLIENKEATACYIQKYITKDFIKSVGGTAYICSRGLKTCESYELEDLYQFTAFDTYDFENEFVKIKNIDLYKEPDLAFYFSFVAKYKDDYIIQHKKSTAKEFIDFFLTKIKDNDKLIIT